MLFVHLNDRLENHHNAPIKTAYMEAIEEAGQTLSQKIIRAVQYNHSGAMGGGPKSISQYADLFPKDYETQLQALADKLQESDLPIVVVDTEKPEVGKILQKHGFRPIEELLER